MYLYIYLYNLPQHSRQLCIQGFSMELMNNGRGSWAVWGPKLLMYTMSTLQPSPHTNRQVLAHLMCWLLCEWDKETHILWVREGGSFKYKGTNLDILPCTRSIWESMISKTLHMFKLHPWDEMHCYSKRLIGGKKVLLKTMFLE
jgi:hypothetical protein